MSGVDLNTILKAGYGNKKSKNELANKNYVLDKDLSNKNNFIYVNDKEKKIVHNVKGTNPFSLQDIGTDLYLGLNKLENTNRFKDSKKRLSQAKDKYKDYNTTVTGHSLGSSIGEKIADKNKDKFFGLNGYYQPFKPTSSNNGRFEYYRTEFDPISLFGANKTNVKTLINKHDPTGIIPIDLLKAHSVSANDKNIVFV
jgi:hypothetical protein